jgi:hypothetical protein
MKKRFPLGLVLAVSVFMSAHVAFAAETANLALGKFAEQSSVYPGGDAAKAVDGNTNGDWRGKSVSHTKKDNTIVKLTRVEHYANISSTIGDGNDQRPDNPGLFQTVPR